MIRLGIHWRNRTPAGHAHTIGYLLYFDAPVSRRNWHQLVNQMLFNAGKDVQE